MLFATRVTHVTPCVLPYLRLPVFTALEKLNETLGNKMKSSKEKDIYLISKKMSEENRKK